MADLFPKIEGKAPRHVDKLVKVFTRKGEVKWVLVHIEVQGHKDPDFAFRMFTYYYRILDKYRMPVTAMAIFTDSTRFFHPSRYEQEFLGTGNSFYFNTYKVLNQSQEQLERDANPFSIAILTVLIGLKSKNLKDEKRFELKYKLLRNLFRRQISKSKIDGLLLFIQLYVDFEKTEYNFKFEKIIDELKGNQKSMGIREFVLDRARKEGVEKGMSEKNLTFTSSLVSETDFDDAKIAKLTGTVVEFVQEVRKEMESKLDLSVIR